MRHFYDSTLSEFDFEQLPPALQRKFFSSLERLRLAQDGTFSTKPTHDLPSLFAANTSHPYSPARLIQRSWTHLDHRLTRSSSSPRKRLRKTAGSPARYYLVSQQEVDQYAALPPTLQRKQFSREHQFLLASRINSIILDAADEAVYKRFWSQQLNTLDRQPSRDSAHQATWLDPTEAEGEDVDVDADEDEADIPFDLDSYHRPEHTNHDVFVDDDMDFSASDLESFRWLDEPQDLDLSLYDYHAAVAETAARQSDPPQKHASKRSLSISSISFPRLSMDKKHNKARASLPASLVQSRSTSATPTMGHRRNKGSFSSLDPGATHYQDPSARAKLRVYLASPQKFDEAIEFGFPSMHDRTTMRPSTRQKGGSRPTNEIGMTFFDDDTPSLSDGDDRDFEDVESPRTPSATAFSHAISQDSSLDRNTFRPRLTRDLVDSYVHGSASNREMTLHMTLTRPDLRSPEEMSTRNINSVPLEQPPLIFPPTNTASFWDSLPDEESKMKKLFRRFKRRG